MFSRFKLKEPIPLSKKTRIGFLFVTIALGLIIIILGKTYRPYIYSHHIYDYHLSDVYSDLLGMPAGMCYSYVQKRIEYNNLFTVVVVCIILILYEFVGWTFDYLDMLAALVSAIPCYFIFEFIFRKAQRGYFS